MLDRGSRSVKYDDVSSDHNPIEDAACGIEWAESFDTKDWARLAQCLAPTLSVVRGL